MYGLTYISDQNRKRLESIKEELAKSPEKERKDQLLEEMQEIEKTRKPIQKCTIEECMNLKRSLYDRYTKLINIGHTAAANQFLGYIQVVESRMMFLTLEEKKQKENEKSQKNQENERTNRAKGTDKSKTRKRANSWSIDLGDLD